MKKCYDCEHYFESWMCGYAASNCKVYGSLDCDQKERHPDRTANSCPDFSLKKK